MKTREGTEYIRFDKEENGIDCAIGSLLLVACRCWICSSVVRTDDG